MTTWSGPNYGSPCHIYEYFMSACLIHPVNHCKWADMTIRVLLILQTLQSCQEENIMKLLSKTNLQLSQLDLSRTDCPALNISQCEVTESAGTFLVHLYNPLSRPVTHYVRLPVLSASYEVYDHRGEKIPTQFNEIPSFIRNIPGKSTIKVIILQFEGNNFQAAKVWLR